jgi:putative endonuclease
MRRFQPAVYIMSNRRRTTFYIGVTGCLPYRLWLHRLGKGSKFTARYQLVDLVYFELFDSMVEAIERDTQLKNWHRQWKIDRIKSVNPEMVDLADTLWG